MEILNTRLFPRHNWQKSAEICQISGLSQSMDIVIVNGEITYNTSLKQARTVYMDTRKTRLNINLLVNVILQKINQKINVIIAGEDTTYPNSIDIRHDWQSPWLIERLHCHEYVNKIFVENLDSCVDKSEPLPLGINPNLCPTDWEYFSRHEKIDPDKQLKAVNFNVVRMNSAQWSERFYVKHLCETSWKSNYLPCPGEISHRRYLEVLSENMFSICVHGGGLDPNPKLWEALLVGSIPIIRENKPHTDIYMELNLPVVIVKDWSIDTINSEELKTWRDRYYYDHFSNKQMRGSMLEKLSLDYWIKRVHHI